MRNTISFLSTFLLLVCVGWLSTDTVKAQFSFESASSLTVKGTVIDASKKKGLANALVTVRTDYDEYRTYTDGEGDFTLEIAAPREMKNVELVFSHPDFREKYFQTAFDRAMRGTFEAQVENGHVKVKHYKTNADLKCGEQVSLGTKDGEPVTGVLTCENGQTFTLKLADGNALSVTAANPIQLKVVKEHIAVHGLNKSAVTVGVTAMLYKR